MEVPGLGIESKPKLWSMICDLWSAVVTILDPLTHCARLGWESNPISTATRAAAIGILTHCATTGTPCFFLFFLEIYFIYGSLCLFPHLPSANRRFVLCICALVLFGYVCSFVLFLRFHIQGVPFMAQQLTSPTRIHEDTASIPGLGIQCCPELGCRSQTGLRSGVAVAVV